MSRALRLLLDVGLLPRSRRRSRARDRRRGWPTAATGRSRRLAWSVGFTFDGTLRGWLAHRDRLVDAWSGTAATRRAALPARRRGWSPPPSTASASSCARWPSATCPGSWRRSTTLRRSAGTSGRASRRRTRWRTRPTSCSSGTSRPRAGHGAALGGRGPGHRRLPRPDVAVLGAAPAPGVAELLDPPRRARPRPHPGGRAPRRTPLLRAVGGRRPRDAPAVVRRRARQRRLAAGPGEGGLRPDRRRPRQRAAADGTWADQARYDLLAPRPWPSRTPEPPAHRCDAAAGRPEHRPRARAPRAPRRRGWARGSRSRPRSPAPPSQAPSALAEVERGVVHRRAERLGLAGDLHQPHLQPDRQQRGQHREDERR